MVVDYEQSLQNSIGNFQSEPPNSPPGVVSIIETDFDELPDASSTTSEDSEVYSEEDEEEEPLPLATPSSPDNDDPVIDDPPLIPLSPVASPSNYRDPRITPRVIETIYISSDEESNDSVEIIGVYNPERPNDSSA